MKTETKSHWYRYEEKDGSVLLDIKGRPIPDDVEIRKVTLSGFVRGAKVRDVVFYEIR